MYKEEMTLKELLGSVCARWRMVLVFALACALAVGGYRTYSRMQSISSDADVEQALETYRIEQQLYDVKKAQLAAQIDKLTLQEEQAIYYYENSLLMHVDPYNKQVARIAFRVNVDVSALAREMPEAWQIPTSVDLRAEREDQIAGQYVLLTDGVSLGELIKDTYGVRADDPHLRELVEISNQGQGIVVIQVISTEQFEGMELAEKLFTYCKSKQKSVAAVAGAHTIEVVDTANMVLIDPILCDTQLSAQDRPADIAVQLAAKVKEMEEIQAPSQPATVSSADSVKSGVKFAVLGAVVGAVFGAVIAFFAASMSAYFSNGAVLAQATASRYLGNLRPYSRKRGLDAWAETLLGADIFSLVATADRMPLLAANLREAAGDKRRILITGMRAQAGLESLTGQLQEQLGEEYRLIAAANLLINADAIRQLKNVDGVVMVEGEKTAQIERVQKTKQYLDEAEKDLVGVVWA